MLRNKTTNTKGKIMYIRISDNVLEPNIWGFDKIYFDENKNIYKQITIKNGCYSLPNCIGWNIDQLFEWQNYSNDEIHPQNYCEVSKDGYNWLYLLTKEEFISLISRAQ